MSNENQVQSAYDFYWVDAIFQGTKVQKRSQEARKPWDKMEDLWV